MGMCTFSLLYSRINDFAGEENCAARLFANEEEERSINVEIYWFFSYR